MTLANSSVLPTATLALALLTTLFHAPGAIGAQTTFPAAPTLRRDQIESLILLSRVWGFAKYHHSRFVVHGADVDKALRDGIPRVLAATSAHAARDSIAAWLDGLGAPSACTSCAVPPTQTALPTDIGWIGDTAAVGPAIASRLARIYAARHRVTRQHYVGPVANVGNPEFSNELPYLPSDLADPTIRALAVFRLWNVLEYWFPYRDLMEPDRVAILRDALPSAWGARQLDDYKRSLQGLLARARDTHANVWSALDARPPVGAYALPVSLRMIEGKPVVWRFSNDTLGPRSGLRIGDAILAVDGVSVASLFRAWTPLYAASNQPRREYEMARGLARGEDSSATLLIDRDGRQMTLQVPRAPIKQMGRIGGLTHDLPGPTFQMLAPEVAYMKIGPLRKDSVAQYLERARGTKVLVLDLRNYPSDFPIHVVSARLTPFATPFAKFTVADWSNPGAFLWGATVSTRPAPRPAFDGRPEFSGRVVILVDEVTLSSAEFHAMAFRTAPGSIVVGSTTAGADGNVSPIPLPGGMQAGITGIGVFYPDGRPTQQVGIVPDLVVRPTLRGVRAGRDEVLEAGVSRLLGREFRMARPPTGPR
jgi:C-terminal processing protease CtpA/Prc